MGLDHVYHRVLVVCGHRLTKIIMCSHPCLLSTCEYDHHVQSQDNSKPITERGITQFIRNLRAVNSRY